MENKATSELLDFLWKIERKEESTDEEWEEYEEANAELVKREPFKRLLGESEYPREYLTHEEKLEELSEDVKLLKRHKHDSNNGDVLVRI